MTASPERAPVTAALLVIGDEILSGRTKDKNIGHIAERLTAVGIDLREVRVVPDVEDDIVAALNALRARYHYVFTTGGIGPTHDDITADCVAKAFGVPIDVDPRARDMLLDIIAPADLNAARLRMARIPEGASLVENTVSRAPGFHIGNVYVMAGIPRVMHAMLEVILPELEKGPELLSRAVRANAREGDVAGPLAMIAQRHPRAMIGSYPFLDENGPNTEIVVRARNHDLLDLVAGEVRAMVAALPART